MFASSQAVQSIEQVAVQRLSVLKAQIPVGGRKKAGGCEDLRSGPERVRRQKIFKKTIFSQSHAIQQSRRLFSFLALR